VENGTYQVTLKFAEIYWNAAGKRQFDAIIEDTEVITDLDLFQTVGKNVAYDLTFETTVTDGELNIIFLKEIDNAKISAIQITTSGTGTSQFTLSVNSGTGGGNYEEGTVVDISADVAPAGQEFDVWTGDTANLADVNSASTTVTIPAGDVTVTATYKDLPGVNYVLTVNFGIGGGSYPEGTVLDILADTAPAGKTFDVWIGDTAYLADINSQYTTVTMPAGDVTVTATYKDLPQQGNTVFAVNCGGGAFTAVDGTKYVADGNFVGGKSYANNGAAIANTEDDVLYRSERYGNMSYDIPVENGVYDVTLKFAEIYHNDINKRIFDVLIEDQELISNLDIYLSSADQFTAYDLTFTVNVTDGVLNIDFLTDIDNAKISAILVTE